MTDLDKLKEGGPFEVTYVGGPYDGQVRLYDHLGTTWSRQQVKDADGETLGYYTHWGPGHLTCEWDSIEDYRQKMREIEADYFRMLEALKNDG